MHVILYYKFFFEIAHILGKTNTAADLISRLQVNPNEKLILKIQEDAPTQPIEVNIHSTGITQEDQVFFHADGVGFPSEKQLWQRKQEKSNTVHMEPPVETVPHCYKNDSCRNTLRQSMESFDKVTRNLIEQNADPVLLKSKKKCSDYLLINKSSQKFPDTLFIFETKNAS